jgi:mRNA interferase MazF
MLKGDIILVPFPFTNLSTTKLRPALILIENTLDVTVSFITTQLQWLEPTDIILQPQPANGIKKPSLVRLSKMATIDKSLIVGTIGSIDQNQLAEVNLNLKLLFQIP